MDLLHEGLERVIGVYLLETSDGLALNGSAPRPASPPSSRGSKNAAWP